MTFDILCLIISTAITIFLCCFGTYVYQKRHYKQGLCLFICGITQLLIIFVLGLCCLEYSKQKSLVTQLEKEIRKNELYLQNFPEDKEQTTKDLITFRKELKKAKFELQIMDKPLLMKLKDISIKIEYNGD